MLQFAQMNISIRAFASYREAIGAQRLSVDVPEGSTAAQVWDGLLARYPRLVDLPRPAAFAVNDEYISGEATLRDSDELALIPPVSGGAHVALVHDPIDVTVLLRTVSHPQAGGIVLFLGTVRDHARGQRVRYLEYEAYQTLATREMQRIADEAEQRWPLLGLGIVHRLGHLEVGEISVAIAASSAHRREAFEAGRFAIDTLKQTVPIWKKEVWEGGEVWVSSEKR